MYWPSPEDGAVDMKESVFSGKYRQASPCFLEQILAAAEQDEDQQLFTARVGPTIGSLGLQEACVAPSRGPRMPAQAAWTTNSGCSAGTCFQRHQEMWSRHHQYPR